MFRNRSFSGLLIPCLFAFFAPAALVGQEAELPPAFLRDHALVVRFLASAFDSHALPAGSSPSMPQRAPTWTSKSLRYTMSGTPVAIRLAGNDLVVVVQVTPYDHGANGLLVVAQGQVWRRKPDGQLDYRSVFESLYVAWGERVFFYPLGRQSDGAAPMSLEIAVEHYGENQSKLDTDPALGGPPGGETTPQGGPGSAPVSPGKR